MKESDAPSLDMRLLATQPSAAGVNNVAFIMKLLVQQITIENNEIKEEHSAWWLACCCVSSIICTPCGIWLCSRGVGNDEYPRVRSAALSDLHTFFSSVDGDMSPADINRRLDAFSESKRVKANGHIIATVVDKVKAKFNGMQA